MGILRPETTQHFICLTIFALQRVDHRFHPREIEVARQRISAQNVIHEVNTGIATGTPAKSQNRHLLSQAKTPSACQSEEIHNPT